MVYSSLNRTRKLQRKEERAKKKQRRALTHLESTTKNIPTEESTVSQSSLDKDNKKKKKPTRPKNNGKHKDQTIDDPYAHLAPDVAASMKRDDEEIAELERKLGLSSGGKNDAKEKDRLFKEYAKLECYGDDFGEFLDGLDDMMARVKSENYVPPKEDSDDAMSNSECKETMNGGHDSSDSDLDEEEYSSQSEEEMRNSKKKIVPKSHASDDPYAHLAPDVAAAMKRDDEEIAELEIKLGLNSVGKKDKSKEKNRLYREYAKLECYGDDFGDFLDGLDDMMVRVKSDNYVPPSKGEEDDTNFDTSDLEEMAAMKERAVLGDHESESDLEQEEYSSQSDKGNCLKKPESETQQDSCTESEDEVQEGSDGDEDSAGSDEDLDSEEDDDEGSHHGDTEQQKQAVADDNGDNLHTYRPSSGEDIYGNKIDDSGQSRDAPKKYVPPHLREKHQQHHHEDRKTIERSLNNALNRLSEDTLISVSQTVAGLYKCYPTTIVNECFWKNARDACVVRPFLMTGLVPVYAACIAGVHIHLRDSAMVGEFMLEMAVTDLWQELESSFSKEKSVKSAGEDQEGGDDESLIKKASNLCLILGYLYNYGIVHCTLIYDVIRHLIKGFGETDVELLLIILSHCGRPLRSDDPSALKDIVTLVQTRSLESNKENNNTNSSSRVEYMVSAMMDLKNNKKRKQDSVHEEKMLKLRKLLGRIKSEVASAGVTSALRISLEDVLNAKTKGRWWKVGASWVGNQQRKDDSNNHDKHNEDKQTQANDDVDEKLLKLASKYRMNTDTKRAIFCIIMSSTDRDDAFEKLVRKGMLKNRTERDVVRVLMECCGNESSFNPFYAHLACRVCEYQPQSKFTFQLAFWDTFKQFDDISVRKAANLAKLLFHLVAIQRVLKLTVLKTIDDMSSPEDLPETAMIFLTMFFSSILDHFDDPNYVKQLFKSTIHNHKYSGTEESLFQQKKNTNVDMEHMIDEESLGASISVFFLQALKASPKYKKGSKFRANFKAVLKVCDMDEL